MDKVLYIKDVCEKMNVKPGYLYKLINTGEIKSFKMGKKRAFMQSSVDNYLIEKSGIEEQKVIPLTPKDAMATGLGSFDWNKFGYDQLCLVWSLIGRLEGEHE